MNSIELKDLKEMRKEKGWSQMTVCEKVGVALLTYQLWERGIATPHPKNYDKLVEIFTEGGN